MLNIDVEIDNDKYVEHKWNEVQSTIYQVDNKRCDRGGFAPPTDTRPLNPYQGPI